MEKPKSGMEQMLNNMLRMAGFDPLEIGKHIEQTVGQIFAAMKALQDRLDKIDIRQDQTNARLERIERMLAIADEVEENQETERRLISG